MGNIGFHVNMSEEQVEEVEKPFTSKIINVIKIVFEHIVTAIEILFIWALSALWPWILVSIFVWAAFNE